LRPLFFDYHNDPTLPKYGSYVHENQFLVGDSIMVAPILYDKTSRIDVYFPNKRWFDLTSNLEVPVRGDTSNIVVSITDSIPHFLQGGHLLFTQEIDEKVQNTRNLGNIFTITVALSDFSGVGNTQIAQSEGNILAASSYDEQYIYDHCVKQNCLLTLLVQFKSNHDDGALSLEFTTKGVSNDPIKINQIKLMGVPPNFAKRLRRGVFLDNNALIKVEKSHPEMIQLNLPAFETYVNKFYKIIFS